MRFKFLVALACLCSSMAARADSYLYDFDDTQVDWKFTYLSPSLLTETFTSFTPDTCTIKGDPRSCYVRFEINNGIYGNSIGFEYAYLGSIPERFFSDLGPNFFTVGTHTSGSTTLVISQVSTVSPEPSSIALLGTGVLGLVGAARRRFAA